MKDCEGHEAEDDLNPSTRACKAYVALCCGGGDYHDEYFDGDMRTAIVDILADLMHLADHEGLRFYQMFVSAEHHFFEERHDWLSLVKATCIEQAVEANLR